MPAGLIPLMLIPAAANFGPRTSFILPANKRIPSSPAHKRNASDSTHLASFQLSKPAPKTMKRQSQQAPASLPVLPYTPAEWRKAIADIKCFHVTQRYRACSARCNEILSNIKNTSAVEPAYMIYLRFYAAMSLEMCARPLPAASSYRTSLLHQARSHYDQTASLIRTAEELAESRSRSSSPASSTPGLQSPGGSVSSSSTASWENPLRKRSSFQSQPRPKKSVSFELPERAPRETSSNRLSARLPDSPIIIRPDSPTLGFDDEYFTAAALRPELPEVPAAAAATMFPPSMPAIREEEPSPCSATFFYSSSSDSSSSSSSSDDDSLLPYDHDHDHVCARSLARYCETLSYLRAQVAVQTASLDGLLHGGQQQQGCAQSPFEPSSSSSSSSSSSALQRLSISGGSSLGLNNNNSSSSDDEARELDKRARIDRLRMTGWKRQRFDASRYQELCDAVMAELHD